MLLCQNRCSSSVMTAFDDLCGEVRLNNSSLYLSAFRALAGGDDSEPFVIGQCFFNATPVMGSYSPFARDYHRNG